MTVYIVHKWCNFIVNHEWSPWCECCHRGHKHEASIYTRALAQRIQENTQASARCRRVYTRRRRREQLYLLSVVGNKCKPPLLQLPSPLSDFDVCLSAMICLTIFSREGDESETHAGEHTCFLTHTCTHNLNCNPNSCQLETHRFLFSDPWLKSWAMFAQSAHNPPCFRHRAADLSWVCVCVCACNTARLQCVCQRWTGRSVCLKNRHLWNVST